MLISCEAKVNHFDPSPWDTRTSVRSERLTTYLVTEEHATYRRTKSHRQASRTGNAEHLSHLPAVSTVLGEPTGDQISDASGYVNKRAFLSQVHSRSHGEGGA